MAFCEFPSQRLAAETEVLHSRVVELATSALDAEDLGSNQRDLWKLSKEEWERVQFLRDGIRKYLSDDQISPLEILGIHARSDQERERYAQRWAKLMLEDAERVLRFQRAYDQAISSLNSNEPLIDLSQLPPKHSTVSALIKTDRIALFIELDCDVCYSIAEMSLAALPRVDGLDIYFVDLGPQDQLSMRRWATRLRVPPPLVESKRVTLNPDAGLLKRVNPRATYVPVLMKRRGDTFHSIAVSDLN